MGRGAWWATVHGVAELDTIESLILSLFNFFHHWKKGQERCLLSVLSLDIITISSKD